MVIFRVLTPFGFDYAEDFGIESWGRLNPEEQTSITYRGVNFEQTYVGTQPVPTSDPLYKVDLHGVGLGAYQSYGPSSGTIKTFSVNLDDRWLFEIAGTDLQASTYNRIVQDTAFTDTPYERQQAKDLLIGAALAGEVVIFGSDGRDRLPTFGASNFVDGGTGLDSVIYNISSTAVRAFQWNNQGVVFNPATKQLDRLADVETLEFTDRYISLENLPDPRPLEYIATYADLRIYGSVKESGFQHFQDYGIVEGRSVSFDGLDYIVSYDDLIAALPHTNDAGATHFIENGAAEGRRVLFDPVQYIASYDDLVRAFSTRVDLKVTTAAEHYLEYGISEGRARDAFDARQYLANYADLRAAFGSDEHAAAQHYILNGYAEGRSDNLL